MRFFKDFFNTTERKEKKVLPWIPLDDLNQLDIISERSHEKIQIIFKHSTRCGISSMVLNQFIERYDLEMDVDLYFLDLLSYRQLSDEVGYRFQVMHQSPQVIVIKNNGVVAHASHGAISTIDFHKMVKL